MRNAQGYDHPEFIGDQSGGTAVSPAGWLFNNIKAWFVGTVENLMTGRPAPNGASEAYPMQPDGTRSPVKQPHPFGGAKFTVTRRFDRGAAAYAYQGGALAYDPIGAGIVTTRPLPIMQGAFVKVPFGQGIYWEPQQVNYGIQPRVGYGLVTPQQLAAIAGNPALAGGDPSVTYIPIDDGGFSS